MAAVFSTFLRGLLGIAVSVLLVAVAWTLYVQRDSVRRVAAPLIELFAPAAPGPAAADGAARRPARDAKPRADGGDAAGTSAPREPEAAAGETAPGEGAGRPEGTPQDADAPAVDAPPAATAPAGGSRP